MVGPRDTSLLRQFCQGLSGASEVRPKDGERRAVGCITTKLTTSTQPRTWLESLFLR